MGAPLSANTLLTNSPNYLGMLYNSDPRKTTFLQVIGGLGASYTTNPEFPTSVEYEIGNPSQPAISENDSLTFGTPTTYVKSQYKNVTQIFQEFATISRRRTSAEGRLSGINTVGGQPEETSEESFQINRAIQKTARDVNYTLINGTFSDAGLTNSAVATTTRGMLEAITTNVVNAGLTALTKDMIDELVKGIFDNGPRALNDTMLFVNSTKKQEITQIYGVVPYLQVEENRFRAGINVERIVTDFGELLIAVDNDVPSDTVMAVTLVDDDGNQIVRPVHARLENGDFLLIKEISQTGGKSYEIYHETGLDHGPEFYHGKIIDLT